MKILKFPLCLASIMFSAIVATAQINQALDMPKYKDIAEIKNRQLIVVVNPPDPGIIGKFDKKSMPDVVQQYQQIIGAYNDNLKYFVTKFWTFNAGPVLYKTREEIDEMMKDKSLRDKYYLMYCYSYSYSISKDLQLKINHNGERMEGTPCWFSVGYYDESPFYKTLMGLIPELENLAFIVPVLNSCFNYIYTHSNKQAMSDMTDENAPILTSKTLLIPKDFVESGFINQISHYYPGKYKLVSDDELMKAVETGDTTCAYAAHENLVYIVNCKDGAIMAYTTKNVASINNSSSGEGLRKEFFTDIAAFYRAGMKK